MSIATVRPMHTDALVIRCNGCVNAINVGGAINHRQARELAARAGWTSKKIGKAIKDVCPDCQKEGWLK